MECVQTCVTFSDTFPSSDFAVIIRYKSRHDTFFLLLFILQNELLDSALVIMVWLTVKGLSQKAMFIDFKRSTLTANVQHVCATFQLIRLCFAPVNSVRPRTHRITWLLSLVILNLSNILTSHKLETWLLAVQPICVCCFGQKKC